MGVIIGTDDGRIFMGGDDGCVYELVYQVTEPCLSIVAQIRAAASITRSSYSRYIPSIVRSPSLKCLALLPSAGRSTTLSRSCNTWCPRRSPASLVSTLPLFRPPERDPQVLTRPLQHSPSSSLLNLAGSKPERILQLCYDHTRRVLYARTHSYVQAYDAKAVNLVKEDTIIGYVSWVGPLCCRASRNHPTNPPLFFPLLFVPAVPT